jgi:hypothetical protein
MCQFTRTAGAALLTALLVIVPWAARADTYVQFTLLNVYFGPLDGSFTGDATASGSFVLDVTTDAIFSENITTAAAVSFPTGLTGSFPGTSYTDATQASVVPCPSLCGGGLPASTSFTFGAGNFGLQLTVAGDPPSFATLPTTLALETSCGGCGISFESDKVSATSVPGREINQGSLVLSAFSPVPGPIVGTGLPGLIFASGGLLAWWRRKRSAQATA